jgi:hypothetical protein
MDYQPGHLPGETSEMGTYHSRGLVRATTVGGVVVLAAGLLLALLATGTTASLGAIVAALGGLAVVPGVLTLVQARRHPAPETGPGAHAGPREAGW